MNNAGLRARDVAERRTPAEPGTLGEHVDDPVQAGRDLAREGVRHTSPRPDRAGHSRSKDHCQTPGHEHRQQPGHAERRPGDGPEARRQAGQEQQLLGALLNLRRRSDAAWRTLTSGQWPR